MFFYYLLNLQNYNLYTEYIVLCEDHADAGNQNFSSILTYNQYHFAWHSFISLLDIDYKKWFLVQVKVYYAYYVSNEYYYSLPF